MITITEGMTSDQFNTAMNANFAELGVNNVDADSFRTITTLLPGNDFLWYLNHNFRSSLFSAGQSGRPFVNVINSNFSETILRFKDNFIENVISDVEWSAEPSALVSPDGQRLDLWCDFYYTYTTDGVNFAAAQNIHITGVGGVACPHIMLVDGVYYLFTSDPAVGILLRTGTDRVNFIDQGLVLPIGGVGDWDAAMGNMFVWKEGNNWFMLYEAKGVSQDWRIGLATANNVMGPWTKYIGNPLITGVGEGAGNPELPRVNNEVIKHNGLYYMYYHYDNHDYVGQQGVWRAYSSDLHNWTIEGPILNVHHEHEIATIHRGYGDQALVQFKGKSYLFFTCSGEYEVNPCHIDCAIDNRTLAEMLALYP